MMVTVYRFCEANVSSPDPKCNGYIVKVPYTTNQKYKKLQNVDDIVRQIIRYRDKYIGVIPYVMLQAYLHDTVEFKIVCFDCKALYEADIANSSKATHEKKAFLVRTNDSHLLNLY